MSDEPQVTHGHLPIPDSIWTNIEWARSRGRNSAEGCVAPDDQQRVWDVLKLYDVTCKQSQMQRAMKSYYFTMQWEE